MGKEIDAGNVEAVQQFVEAAPRGADDQLWAVAERNLVVQFIERGERDRLVRLLAAGRNGNSSYSSIERLLTLEVEWNKIEDRLMPLFDAFDAAINDEAREQVYNAAWGALGDAPLKTTDRRAYMAAARAWYVAHRHELERCPDYDHMFLGMWRQGMSSDVPPCHLLKLRAGD